MPEGPVPEAPLAVAPYRGYAELAGAFSDIARVPGVGLERIGTSVGEAPLMALTIGPEIAPASLVLLAGIHPMEWIGVEVLVALLARLASNPLPDRRVVAFPLVNVDGYRQVEGDLRAGRRRWRRSNLRGVDLNRNWEAFFAKARPGRQRMLGGWNNGGSAPLSEPEVAAIAHTLDRVHESAPITLAISLHSFGRMILIPYGGAWRRSPKYAALANAARALAARMPERYRIRQVSRWVPGVFVRGAEIDHIHERYGAVALLVECTGGGLSAALPRTWLHPFHWYNPLDPVPCIAGLASALEAFLRHG